MVLGDKLFEGTGDVVAFRITKVHPMEGTTMEVSFVEDLKGIGKFPSGKNTGSGTITRYAHGIEDASYNGFVTFQDGDTFMWWAHEKAKTVEGGKMRGIVTVTGYTNAQKYSWMNSLVMVLESEFDPATQKLRTTGYSWD
jgi:hypothetical protein